MSFQNLLIQFVKFSFGQNIGACINDHTKFKTHFKQFKFFFCCIDFKIFSMKWGREGWLDMVRSAMEPLGYLLMCNGDKLYMRPYTLGISYSWVSEFQLLLKQNNHYLLQKPICNEEKNLTMNRICCLRHKCIHFT